MTDLTRKTFKKGATLIREGEFGQCAYIIEAGNVEILVQRQGHAIQISTRGPGSIIGEMAMVDDKPRTATVCALDDCTVLEISREDFSRRVNNADPVLKMVLHVIMTRYRSVMTRSPFSKLSTESSTEDIENDDESHDAALGTLRIHGDLKTALANNELILYYQPIIDLKNIKIAGFEALMRWQHPQKGLISPGIFIPVAEESGLIVDMSRWALGIACDAAKKMQAAANPKLLTDRPLFVGVNFSVKDFMTDDFYGQVEETIKSTSTDPEQIHLEITETLLMETPDAAKKALEKCRQLGIDVSIDDFGSGYSSLSYLHNFPITTLKIDQSFIRSITTTEASRVLVKTIIGLARNLNMRVIAEGAETEEEVRILRDMGCDYCQGFWFSKPLPPDAALKFVQEWIPKIPDK